jgi:hypothetical protein
MNQFMVAVQADARTVLATAWVSTTVVPATNASRAEPYAEPTFSNVTYVGRGAAAGKRTVTFRDNAGGHYTNSIFAEQAKGNRHRMARRHLVR